MMNIFINVINHSKSLKKIMFYFLIPFSFSKFKVKSSCCRCSIVTFNFSSFFSISLSTTLGVFIKVLITLLSIISSDTSCEFFSIINK